MRRRSGFFWLGIGLVGVLALWLGGIFWPLTAGYRSVGPWVRDMMETSSGAFDRSGLRHSLTAVGLSLGDAAFVRIFKRERRLELWMRGRGGQFVLFRDYQICSFSGQLGPKLKEGDRQAPEGFYAVTASQLNPDSRHHLAFNLGFPNAYDQALGRTGSFLMVHGGCTSIGCYAMTDEHVDEIYAVMEAALGEGQSKVWVHIFPFVPTEAALARVKNNQWFGFWDNLREGFELFEQVRKPPLVAACGGTYRFGGAARDPACTAIGDN